jgi:hypothetical protein
MWGDCARPWSFHVLVAVEGDDSLSKLHMMDVWLRQWKIPYRVVSVPRDAGAIRVCFSEEKYARAFQVNFGARRVRCDAVATAQAAGSAETDFHQLVENTVAK